MERRTNAHFFLPPLQKFTQDLRYQLDGNMTSVLFVEIYIFYFFQNSSSPKNTTLPWWKGLSVLVILGAVLSGALAPGRVSQGQLIPWLGQTESDCPTLPGTGKLVPSPKTRPGMGTCRKNNFELPPCGPHHPQSRSSRLGTLLI